MNLQVNPADTALAMYETACETHMRRDWREACHALAKALKLQLAANASRAAIDTAMPVPAPVAKAKAPKAKAAPVTGFDMSAGSLASAFKLLGKVTEKRNNYPICAHAHMLAMGDTLQLTATDLDMEILIQVDAPGIGQWEATAETHALATMLAKFPKGAQVALQGESLEPRILKSGAVETLTRVTVQCAGSTATLAGRDLADYPHMVAKWSDKAPAFYMPSDALADALAFVTPSISTEETRYYLNGAYVHVMPGKKPALRVVSTDGHRASVWETSDIPKGAESMFGVIIPRKAVSVARSFLGQSDRILLTVSPSHVEIGAGPVRLISKLIDGSFPDYQRIIPRDNAKVATFDSESMTDAVSRVAHAATDKKAPLVRFTWGDDDGVSVRLATGAKDAGADYAIPIDWQGEPILSGFNGAYMRDAMNALGAGLVKLAMADAGSPVLVKPAKEAGPVSRLLVLMPIRPEKI
jgi:DNA polymerase-3 subunit beta